MFRVVPQLRQVTASALFLLVITVSTTTAGSDYTSPQTIAGAQTIDAERLIELVEQNDNLLIIDSRLRSDRKLGHIPGSMSLPDTQTRCDSLATLIVEKSDPVIFYCNGPRCRRSDKAVATAVQCGYTNIYWFRGGIRAWESDNYPINK